MFECVAQSHLILSEARIDRLASFLAERAHGPPSFEWNEDGESFKTNKQNILLYVIGYFRCQIILPSHPASGMSLHDTQVQ
jgi:hypothetical protein